MRCVRQVRLGDGGGPADVIDPNDQRLDVLRGALDPESQPDKTDGHHGQTEERELEVPVHHQRGAVLLDVPAACVAVLIPDGRQDGIVGGHGVYPTRRGKVDSPAWPEKSDVVRDGTLSRP